MIDQENVTFLLGPTNTGKTFYAIERLLTHKTGFFGLPLRLLAREVYEKIANKVGKPKVALITGEEQIIPLGARYFISTVEAMPTKLSVDFVAVDEIQLCNDYERGHIFTDKLLHSRGDIETIFLGSSSMENIISTLFPSANIMKKVRRSKIAYTGKKNLFSLPKRAAIIAFNINDIYHIASKVKAVKGGAAIVMGALSPQTRNAQVSMFEEGMVDYIVATDAIGMGLNLNIEHVALSSKRKYDGKSYRNLSESELAQIVGRAGRNRKDGSFGVTLKCDNLDNNLVSLIEQHKFKSINFLYWRTRNLDFSSLTSLIKSLEKKSSNSFLVKTQNTEDENLLKYLSSIKKVYEKLTHDSAIQLLWEISSIPDYLKNFGHSFSDQLVKIFCDISSFGKINSSWVIKELRNLNNENNSIEMLTYKLAKTRFWNYLSNKNQWLVNNGEIKDFAKLTEQKLSEDLHNKLIDEFVDKKLNYYLKEYSPSSKIKIYIDDNNKIFFNQKLIGEILGLKIKIYDKSSLYKNSVLKNIISSQLKELLEKNVTSFVRRKDIEICLNNFSEILISNAKVGTLYKGQDLYSPNVLIENNSIIEEKFYKSYSEKIRELTTTLVKKNYLLNEKGSSNTLKSIFFLIKEKYGFVEKSKLFLNSKKIKKKDILIMKKNNIFIGKKFIYDKRILTKKFIETRWNIAGVYFNLKKYYPPPMSNILKKTKGLDIKMLRSIGYIKINDVAFRINFIEFFFKKIFNMNKKVFIINFYHYRKFNMDYYALCNIMGFLGFVKIAGTESVTYWKKGVIDKQENSIYDKNSPFYVLKKLQ